MRPSPHPDPRGGPLGELVPKPAKPSADSAAEEWSVEPAETLRALELDGVASPHGLALRAAWRGKAGLFWAAVVQTLATCGVASFLGGLGSGMALRHLVFFALFAAPVLALGVVHAMALGERFLRRGGGGETTPAAGRELVGVLGRAGGPVLGTLVASAALVGVAASGALTLALHSLALAGAAGVLALAALAWPVLHVAARVVLLGDGGPGAAWRGVGDALRALSPTYLPGRRTWRRAVWLAIWGVPAVLLPQLALVPLWMVLPASWIGALLLPLQLFVLAGTLDVVALAWSFGYLSGAAEERVRARLASEEEAPALPEPGGDEDA